MAPYDAPRGEEKPSLPIPCRPRQLTRTELRKLDVYAFDSPKLERTVWITGALTFGACLLLEFTPSIHAYCERPRYLDLGGGRSREMTFWARAADGEERLWIVVPDAESDPVPGGHRRCRWEAEALDAAERAHVRLQFLFESELVTQATAISTWLLLLPFVQTARLLPNQMTLEARVREHFRFVKAATFVDIEAALSTFNAHDVRSAVCRGIHQGWLELDLCRPLHAHSVVTRSERHARP